MRLSMPAVAVFDESLRQSELENAGSLRDHARPQMIKFRVRMIPFSGGRVPSPCCDWHDLATSFVTRPLGPDQANALRSVADIWCL